MYQLFNNRTKTTRFLLENDFLKCTILIGHINVIIEGWLGLLSSLEDVSRGDRHCFIPMPIVFFTGGTAY